MSKDNAKHLLNRNIAIMNKSIMEELTAHVRELIQDGAINADNIEDGHYIAFNEDYYIIGYGYAEKWLEKHNVSAFDAINYVIEKDQEYFGESTLLPGDFNSERIVNLIAYFAGDEIDIPTIFEEEQNANTFFNGDAAWKSR